MVLQDDQINLINLKHPANIKTCSFEMVGSGLGIYACQDDYLIYGEVEIIMLNHEFQKVWSFFGNEAFVSLTKKDSIRVDDHSIQVYDQNGDFYELDVQGNLIQTSIKSHDKVKE